MRELTIPGALVVGVLLAAPVAAQEAEQDGGSVEETEEASSLEAPAPGDAEPDPDGGRGVPDRPAPRQALSLHLLGLISGGLAIQYERFPETERALSYAVSLGSRLPSSGDYASASVGLGGELRWWAFNWDRGPWDERVDGGFFLGGRLDVGWYHVWDTVNGGAVGDTLALTPSVLVGWRFDISRLVEITPTLGVGVRTEIDPSGILAAYSRGTVTLGLTVGWMR